MFNFFRHSVPTDAADSRLTPHSVPPAAPSPSIKPHADIQRELVRVVFKDTLRRHGIPSEWLTCEANTVPNGPRGEELHIQLVVVQWHELLMRYARALELQLLRGLDRFEPMVDHAQKCTISWRFSPECGCPFTVLPPPVVWAHDAAPEPVEEEPPSILDRRQRKRPPKDAAPAPAAAPATTRRRDADDPGDYERTELSPFR
ncbi:hypothetical protein HZ993_21445 [Rhodoferax sp. AJA081-3]|uniref:hypothetical protein n=1 Tax=Rhodoferax sp. AJA081-3 TaxID=2752316 RepID=UPI001ADEEF33|nr:hypothetical protein [Rhodoferax sp. AJA081-3]QTN27793.1 hypothetical protein HZ993_21445 [Rhodoferax sp. AJA081-3]